MSFHGLPERHVTACDPTGLHCNRPRPDGSDCCAEMVAANRESDWLPSTSGNDP